jgi:hypothetical protein
MIARRHFWILLFALLLPLAQVAAAAHEVSHAGPALETGSKSGLHGGHCEICALAAQLGGGAAASTPAKVLDFELHQTTPAWHFASRPCVGLIVAFHSRAPPISLLT